METKDFENSAMRVLTPADYKEDYVKYVQHKLTDENFSGIQFTTRTRSAIFQKIRNEN
jgi:hypothetical protein